MRRRERKNFISGGERGLIKKGHDFSVGKEGGVFGCSGEKFIGDRVFEVIPVWHALEMAVFGKVCDFSFRRSGVGGQGEHNGQGRHRRSGCPKKERLGSEEGLPPGGLPGPGSFTIQTNTPEGILHKTRGRIVGRGVFQKIPDRIVFEVAVEVGKVEIRVVRLHGFFRSGEKTPELG